MAHDCEIWQVDLNPARGSEATASRLGRGVITVVPVTSNVASIYPFQVLLSSPFTGLGAESKAQAEQIRSVATEQLLRPIGRLSPDELANLDQAPRLHLEL